MLVFRSVMTAIVGMIPLSATLATMFGVMGLFGFPLDVGSSLVAGIAFGIGIDYAIHLIEAIRRTPLTHSRLETIQIALSQVTLPILVSALVLSSGFSLLLLSGFKSLASLGLLVMVAMIVSAIFSLIILPLVLRTLPEDLFDLIHRQNIRAHHITSRNTEIDDEIIEVEESSPAIRPLRQRNGSIKNKTEGRNHLE